MPEVASAAIAGTISLCLKALLSGTLQRTIFDGFRVPFLAYCSTMWILQLPAACIPNSKLIVWACAVPKAYSILWGIRKKLYSVLLDEI